MEGFRKGMLSLVLVLVFLVTTSAAYAAPAGVKAPPEPNEAYKEAGIESLQYLKDWGTDLLSSGGGYISITGFTQAYQDVDYIMMKLYLQRWNAAVGLTWEAGFSFPLQRRLRYRIHIPGQKHPAHSFR